MFIKGNEGRIWFYRGQGNHILCGQEESITKQHATVDKLNTYANNPFYALLSDEEVILKCKERYEQERQKDNVK